MSYLELFEHDKESVLECGRDPVTDPGPDPEDPIG